jgi:DNA-directed RNA polymerase subunit beta
VIKDKKSKSDEKPIIAKLDEEYHQEAALLKNKLVEKLFTLVNGKTSQGVQTNFKEMIIPKGSKFARKSNWFQLTMQTSTLESGQLTRIAMSKSKF